MKTSTGDLENRARMIERVMTFTMGQNVSPGKTFRVRLSRVHELDQGVIDVPKPEEREVRVLYPDKGEPVAVLELRDLAYLLWMSGTQ